MAKSKQPPPTAQKTQTAQQTSPASKSPSTSPSPSPSPSPPSAAAKKKPPNAAAKANNRNAADENSMHDRVGTAFVDRQDNVDAKELFDDVETEEIERDINRTFHIKFAPYVEPRNNEEREDLKLTPKIDEENQRRYKYNLKYIKEINGLLKRMRMSDYKLGKPPSYYEAAKKIYDDAIREPARKKLEAIKFLREECDMLPIEDYDIDDADKLAEEYVMQEFMKDRAAERHSAKIALDDYAPEGHEHRCNCQLFWDGFSEYCRGSRPEYRVRVAWRRTDDHHFLYPEYEPMCYW